MPVRSLIGSNGNFGLQRRARRVSRRCHVDDVTVRRRFGSEIGRDHLARAGAVFNHHRLPERLAQALSDRARENIVAAARRRADKKAHGLRRVSRLRERSSASES
jgi:hypothetical protein